jgi:hypothetical protein
LVDIPGYRSDRFGRCVGPDAVGFNWEGGRRSFVVHSVGSAPLDFLGVVPGERARQTPPAIDEQPRDREG